MEQRPFTPFVLSCAALGGVFVVDLMTPLGVADWFGYIIVPTFASWWLSRRETFALAGADMLLMAIGYHISRPGIDPTIALYNRIIAAFYIWGTVVVLVRHRQTQRQLRESAEEFRSLFEVSAVGMAEVDLSTRRLFRVNRKFCDITGYSREELLHLTAAQITHPDDLQIDREVFHKSLRRESPDWISVKRYIRKDGSIMWVKVTGTIMYDELGKPFRSLGVIEDITESRKAQEEIETLNTSLAAHAIELEVANRELETFSYSVTHDLRKPLTVISGYCGIIQEMCVDRLDIKCRSYLNEIQDGALRMGALIDTLLKFSFLTRRDLHRETVDLSGLAREVAGSLGMTEPERRVDFRIAEGITVNGDADLIRIVLENLLGNAWKYTATTHEAVIECGKLEDDGKLVCFVRDNGIGFDMEHAGKLFLPFQRVPGTEGFEGHGIGLATVGRIIQRHGGRIWAEGAPDKGATFYFTLPTGLHAP
jgi:PAS domain S-box-containing protein